MVYMKGRMNESQLYLMERKPICGEVDVAAANNHTSNANLWHLRLGHMSQKGLEVLSKFKVLLGDKVEQLSFCEDYVVGKSQRVKFNLKVVHQSKAILDYVHVDL